MSSEARTAQWPQLSRSKLNRRMAGAGPVGTALALLSLVLALLFLMMESHFLMMSGFAFMLLFYAAGSQVSIIASDSLKLIFSGKHIDAKSSQILQTMEELRNAVYIKASGAPFVLSELKFKRKTDLSECIQIYVSVSPPRFSSSDFLNYLKVHFYSDAHEHYQYNASCLDFVGNLMPLFGVAGTLYGMLPVLGAMKEGADITAVSGGMAVAMNATLYGAVFSIFFKVLASRFKQQILALNYHFDEVVSQIRFLFSESEFE